MQNSGTSATVRHWLAAMRNAKSGQCRGFRHRRELHQVKNSWPGENSMSKMSWPMMAAFVAMGVIALMLISGPWSPRVVEKDAAGEVVGGPPRPLAPGTPITSAPPRSGWTCPLEPRNFYPRLASLHHAYGHERWKNSRPQQPGPGPFFCVGTFGPGDVVRRSVGRTGATSFAVERAVRFR